MTIHLKPRAFFSLLFVAALQGAALHANPAEEAKALVGQERYADAVLKFQEALKGDPKNPSLHLGLGLAFQSLKKYGDAVTSVERAAKLSPDSPDAHYSLGLLYEAVATDPSVLGEPKSASVERKYWLKARTAWERVAKLSKDPKRVDVAKEHLTRIREALE